MTSIRILFLLIVFFSVGSCSDSDETNTDLILTVSPEFSFILPVGTTDSCNDKFERQIDLLFDGNSVQAPRIFFQQIVLNWFNPERVLTVYDLTIELNNSNLSGGSFKTALSGDELDGLFGLINGVVGIGVLSSEDTPGGNEKRSVQPNPPDATIRPLGAPDCSLNFGNIAVVSENTAFTAGGTLSIRGISTLENGSDPRPEKAQFAVRVRQDP